MPIRPFSREQTWLFPPTLEELVPAEHPVRYVAAFVDALDRAAWCELGVAPDGAARGAAAYHPRAMVGAWLYGFMSGRRSSRQLERACRDELPYLWLTGWQRPDHNTLWRCYEAHRATLQKGRNGGWLVGYNAQAMVAGLVPERPDDPTAPGGLLITAADVTPDRDDHGQLLPLIDQAEGTTETPLAPVRADGGYHSTAHLVGCAEHAPPVPVLMPDPRAPRPAQAYHKDHFVSDAEADTDTCPQGQPLTFHGTVARGKGKPPDRKYRASKAACAACPVRAHCTTSTTKGRSIAIRPDDAALRAHRAVMATAAARTAYRRRKTLPEPAFGILKEQFGARRCLLRGLANVRAAWALLATAFNLRTRARRCQTPGRLPRAAAA